MTAVLPATDILRKGRGMGSLDDNAINGFSSPGPDWKAKYMEVDALLAETRAELDDFHHSSKELEEELERELERTEKAQHDLKIKVARAEQERDDWKAKFISLQTTYNTTTTSLQRELDTLRKDHQNIKIQLRELEMGNDDLERSERAISSSLADVEQKYARALEEKILLEHELLDKANVEEECQRMKDELRDANEEITILKDQLTAAQQRVNSLSAPSMESSSSASSVTHPTPSVSEENLLNVQTPSDLCLADLTLPPDIPTKDFLSTPVAITSPRPTKDISPSTPPSMLQRAGFRPPRSGVSTPSGGIASLSRSATHPVPGSPSRIHAPRTPLNRPATSRNPSALTTSSTSTTGAPPTAARSKGVQMVSEMRARVKILEQKIHTRVPRLRMGSVTNRAAANAMPPPPLPAKASPSPAPSTASSSRLSQEDKLSTLSTSRRPSVDSDAEARRTPGGGDGWVLIMEDSPSPAKNKEKEREQLRRTSSPPSAPTAFRPMSSISTDSPTYGNSRASSVLSQSVMSTGIRRPQSRLSVSTEGRSSTSTNATSSSASSIPTPSSRPATPTFLPIPSASLHGNGSLKRSTGPGSGAYGQPAKRSSLGGSTIGPPALDSPTFSTHSNATVRASKTSAIPSPGLGQSRIGKPAIGRRSGGGSDPEVFLSDSGVTIRRPRSGSNALLYGRKAT